jgi:hypothetical protein
MDIDYSFLLFVSVRTKRIFFYRYRSTKKRIFVIVFVVTYLQIFVYRYRSYCNNEYSFRIRRFQNDEYSYSFTLTTLERILTLLSIRYRR